MQLNQSFKHENILTCQKIAAKPVNLKNCVKLLGENWRIDVWIFHFNQTYVLIFLTFLYFQVSLPDHQGNGFKKFLKSASHVSS